MGNKHKPNNNTNKQSNTNQANQPQTIKQHVINKLLNDQNKHHYNHSTINYNHKTRKQATLLRNQTKPNIATDLKQKTFKTTH